MIKKIIGQCLLYLLALAMCWVLIGQVIQYNLTINKLVKVSGIINKTTEVGKTKYKSRRKDYELRIFLDDTTEYFRLMDIYKYQSYRWKISKGDTAEIYIRPKWLVPLGMGYRNDIFQMSINRKTIFDISKTRKNAIGIIIISLLAIPISIFLGYNIKRRK